MEPGPDPGEPPRIDARGSQGSQFNQGDGLSLQVNVFEHRADEITKVVQATADEFRADLQALVAALDDAACRKYLPAFMPAGADVAELALTARLLGPVRRGPSREAGDSSSRGPAASPAAAAPASADPRAGETAQPWAQVAAAHDRLVVLADPGMGKSWLIRAEIHRLAGLAAASLANSESDGPAVIPLPIRADVLAAAPGHTLAEAVTRYLVTEDLLPARSEGPMRSRISYGSVVLLVDALDEVPRLAARPGGQPPRNRLYDLLRHWASECAGPARCVLTSRLSDYGGPPVPGSHEVELLGFAPGDAASVVRTWGMPALAVSRVNALLQETGVAGLAQIPLLLALTCAVATDLTSADALPTTRVGLYRALIWQFLSGSHRADRGEAAPAASVIERQAILRVLAHVAASFATASQGWVDRMSYADLAASVRNARAAVAGIAESEADILARLTGQFGLLVPTGNPAAGDHAYVFLHRTIAEYLVACYLADLPPADRLRLIREHQWFDPDWAEVIPMLGALLPTGQARDLVSDFLSQRPDPLHRAFYLAVRMAGEHPDPDRLLTAAQSQAVANRVTSLLRPWRGTTEDRMLQTLAATLTWPNSVTDALLGFLARPEEDMSYPAARALAARRDPRVTSVLIRLLDSDLYATRQSAISALAGHQSAAAASALLALLADQRSGVQSAVVRALAGRSEPAVTKALISGLHVEDVMLRLSCVDGLAGRADASATKALLDLLADDDAITRSAAVRALSTNADAAVVPALVRMLNDRDARVRNAAAGVLTGRPDPEVTRTLLSQLDDGRWQAACTARSTAGRDPIGAEAVIDLVRRHRLDEAAVEVMAQPHDPSIVRFVAMALENWFRRGSVAAAVTQQVDTARTRILASAVALRADSLRAAAATAAAGAGDETTTFFCRLLRDESAAIREAAATALSECPGPGVTDALLGAVRDTNWQVSAAAISALGGRPEPRAADALIGLVRGTGPAHTPAFRALADWGPPQVLAAVCRQRIWPTVTVAEMKQAGALYELADTVADREYLLLPQDERRRILGRLGRLTRVVR